MTRELVLGSVAILPYFLDSTLFMMLSMAMAPSDFSLPSPPTGCPSPPVALDIEAHLAAADDQP